MALLSLIFMHSVILFYSLRTVPYACKTCREIILLLIEIAKLKFPCDKDIDGEQTHEKLDFVSVTSGTTAINNDGTFDGRSGNQMPRAQNDVMGVIGSAT